MKRVLLSILLCAILAGCGTSPSGEAPQRIACLMGSFAQVMTLAGGQVAAAADDAWEDYGLDLEADRLGTIKRPSLEAIFRAEPDLVLASSATAGQVALGETLEAAGVPVVYFDVQNFEDYLALLKYCTDLTGRADLYERHGLAVQEQIDAVLDRVRTQEPPRVLYLRATSTGLRAKGSEGTVLGEMLADLGCINLADGSALEQLSAEYILQADPDFLLFTPMGSEDAARATMESFFEDHPVLASLRAVREGRVYLLDKELFHLKPNARWGEAYETLEAMLYES